MVHSVEEAHRVAEVFLEGLQQLVGMVAQLGALPVVAGCYCNTSFSSLQYNVLKETDTRLDSLGVPILRFLPAIDNGHGHWKLEHRHGDDSMHPNAAGHQAMFESVDLSLFAPERIVAMREQFHRRKMVASRL